MPAVEPEVPIGGAVYHCERHPDRQSYQVGLELMDAEFLLQPDRILAEQRLEELLNGMREMFKNAWRQYHP